MSEKSFNKYSKERISSGVNGIDEMLGGGFPQGHIIVAIGGSGTGKTTLAMHYILDGLIKGESCIYISIEEEKESLISAASAYGWDIEKYINDNKLAIIKLDLSDVKTAARRVKSELPELISSFGAKRLVIDSITLFSMMFDDTIERRIRIFGLNSAIKKAGITALYTAEVNVDNPYYSKDGMIEYSADGVLFLQQNESEKNIKLIMRVIKMRKIQHDRSYRPYEITGNGLVVYSNEMVYNDFGKDTGPTRD
jgi:KaiC domain protein